MLKKIIIACLVNILLIVVGLLSNTIGTDLRSRLDAIHINALATYSIILVFVVLTILLLSWNSLTEPDEDKNLKLISANIEPEIKELYDSLKQRYEQRYRSKVDERFMIPLEVPEDSTSDKPKTYRFSAVVKISNAINAVRKAFDERGRLLIVGSPGSGKTCLLLRLALDLLGDECGANQKLPVIFNLASWSEECVTFEDWMVEVFYSDNALPKNLASTLLKKNRICLLLDGLDELGRNESAEIAKAKRTKCLDSIYAYAEVRHSFVICCRREEFTEIQKSVREDELLPAKVEILDLARRDIEEALEDAQEKGGESRAAAEHLKRIIQTNKALFDVMSTPFYFTIALDVVSKLPLSQKDLPKSPEGIKQYLHGKFVETRIRGSDEASVVEKEAIKITRRLKWLAKFMEQKQLNAFELAKLQPSDLGKRWVRVYKILLFLLTLLSHTMILILVLETSPLLLSYRLTENPLLSVFAAFMLALLITEISFIAFLDLEEIRTKEIIRWNFNKSKIGKAVLAGVSWVLLFLIISVIDYFGGESRPLSEDWLDSFLPVGLYMGFCAGMIKAVNVLRETKRLSYLSSAYQRLKINFNISSPLVIAYVTIVPVLVIGKLSSQLTVTRVTALLIPIGLILPLISSICFCNSPLFKHLVLRICLCLQDRMPLRYVRFMDRLASLRILEKDGGQWRFPHLKLQEYFAISETTRR